MTQPAAAPYETDRSSPRQLGKTGCGLNAEDWVSLDNKMGMAASLEARCPLREQGLVEFAARLLRAFLREGREGKRVLRRALVDLVPKEVLQRPKQGFDVPLADWLRGDLAPLVAVLVLAEGAPLGRWLDPTAIRRLWRRWNDRPDARGAFQLWRLLALAAWLGLHWPSAAGPFAQALPPGAETTLAAALTEET